MSLDKSKLQKLLWAEAASYRTDCADWKRNTEALQEFLGSKTVEEVALELLAENGRLEVERDSSKTLLRDAIALEDQLKAENESLTAKIECFDEGMRAIASSLGASGYNAEHLSAADLVEKVRWGVDHLCDVHERRLGEAKAESEALRTALGNLLLLYIDDEGCQLLPEYIAGRAAMGKEEQP
ncbi:hypothetical protein F2A38_19445 [Pseudomonas chlororaphis]|uniref:Phage protein n=1 Tax=Pseudomonas chlororaphis TaxID=587753 RepID=A0AB34C204_9PSED|nr:hypothetical protein [Pseudomonas chlororaphis]KAA5840207.1 hypothetical protein F2A38_19445 [Pseudomonas chlororaphis]